MTPPHDSHPSPPVLRWTGSMLVLSLALGGGCVSKARYLDEVSDLSARSAKLETKIDDAKDVISRLKRELDRIRELAAEREREMRQSQAELAASRRAAGDLEDEVEQVRLALAELEFRQMRAREALQAYRDLVERFRALIDAGTLEVKVVNGRMIVELATDILFAPGSATLSAAGQEAVRDVAGVLGSIQDRAYQVVGHTDDRPISTDRFPSNWHLGAARAIAVTELLVEAGLHPEQVQAASASEYAPAAPNRTTEGRAANRRIEIVVVPDLSQLPGYDELQGIGKEIRAQD